MAGKEWHDKAPRAIAMLLHIKNAALDNIADSIWTDVCGAGSYVIAHYVDALIADYNRMRTELAECKNTLINYKDLAMEWSDFGFYTSPKELSEERQKELRAIADRWEKEDEEKGE